MDEKLTATDADDCREVPSSLKTSVVVPAYGHCRYLPDLIRALEGGTRRPDEIIVSHSGAHDPSDELAILSPAVLVLHEPKRLFAGVARNRGAARAHGDWLAFIDADVRPCTEWLERILSMAESGTQRFAVGSIGWATTGGYWGMCNWLCEYSEQAPWHPPRQQTGGGSGNMIVSAEDFRRVGGFPAVFRAQDTLLFNRLRSMGREQWFEPGARVDHNNESGFRTFARNQYRMGYHGARVRQRTGLRGSQATKHWPVALLLWMPRNVLLGYRVLLGGPAWWIRGLGYGPGVLLGTWIWTAGFLHRLFETKRRLSKTIGTPARRAKSG